MTIFILIAVAVAVVVAVSVALIVRAHTVSTRTTPLLRLLSSPLPPPQGRYYIGAGAVFMSASNDYIVASSSSKSVFTITGDMTIGVDNKYLDMTSFQWSNNTVYMPILSVAATKWEYEIVPASSRYRFWRMMSSGARVYLAVRRIGVDLYCVIGYTDSIPTETVDEFSIISI
jgi:hypothetical protein